METARDKRWLDANLPHRGRMNLLESVVRWDDDGIVCAARSHREADNPLRRGGELPIASAIEYAAQAAAAHGVLVAGDRGSLAPGFLASVRSVAFAARRLDGIPGQLEVHARRIGGDAGGVLYEFRVQAAGRTLADGRLAVVLDPPRRARDAASA